MLTSSDPLALVFVGAGLPALDPHRRVSHCRARPRPRLRPRPPPRHLPLLQRHGL